MYLKRYLTPLLFILIGLALPATAQPPVTPAPPETIAALEDALGRRLQAAPEAQALTMQLFTPEVDTAFLGPDGETAVVWLALRDDHGQRLAAEPGLALAAQDAQGWQILLPGDPNWDAIWATLPPELIPVEVGPAPEDARREAASAEALTGYYLPWAAGTQRWLEGSISHFQYIPALGYPSCTQQYCQYAYDFTDEWHFPLLASKTGSVVGSRDTCPDGSTSCTNYIVLRTSGEEAYQIYLHLAYGTIPSKLAPGAIVQRGQYLGDTDDTGYSTSQHVHFMVTNSIWMSNSGYYWGYSVPIRFTDVTINNGIPRSCYEVTRFPIYDGATECIGNRADPSNKANDWFTSGNVGAFPPGGTLSTPAAGATVTTGSNSMMDVTARITDDVAVTAVRLIANLNGQWVEIGPKITKAAQPGLYDWDVDLCAAAPVNGPLQVAVRAWDHEGNVSAPIDPRTIVVDHACPPPTSLLKTTETMNSTAIRLTWEAAATGAGLGTFELQWRTLPAGAWDPANTLTVYGTQRSAWMVGQPGATYAFRLRALDVNGQAEAWPAGDEVATTVNLPGSCSPDSAEEDESSDQARPLVLGVAAQRNQCGAGDVDWFSMEIAKPGSYWIQSTAVSGGAATNLKVYAADGTTLVASTPSSSVAGEDSRLIFTIPSAGKYYLKVTPRLPGLFGTDAVYRVVMVEQYFLFLPATTR